MLQQKLRFKYFYEKPEHELFFLRVIPLEAYTLGHFRPFSVLDTLELNGIPCINELPSDSTTLIPIST